MDTLSKLLTDNCKRIKEDRKWTSSSRIVGEAIEDCVCKMACPVCNESCLIKYMANQKSKDIKCEKCNCQIQVKGTKTTKKKQTILKLTGAEYKTTCLSIKENVVHYLVVLYSVKGDKYTVDDILFIDRLDITENCVIPRKPLSVTARRAGWQGCYLHFNKFKSINLSVMKNDI